MKQVSEVTREEYNMLIAFKPKYSYTNDELAIMYNFVKQYVNQYISTCLSCTGSIREAKNQMLTWFNIHQDVIEANLLAQESPKIEIKKKK